MNEETVICDSCGDEFPASQCVEVLGRELCPHCLDEETLVCSHCGERIWRTENAGAEDQPLCDRCYTNHYTNCNRCRTLIQMEEAHYLSDDEAEETPYCASCHEYLSRRAGVRDYYYKPKPVFYGEGQRFFGVELEIDGGGEDSDKAMIIQKIANAGAERVYCKHDGSLDDGFEIVTHPMTLAYHCEEMPWRAVLDKAKDLHYCSHKALTCGLHIHVNRSGLGDTKVMQEEAIARILFFVENHWNELLRFSRRTPSQIEQWAARYGRKDDPKAVLDNAKKSRKGRYTCVNLDNYSTIEFRIFRGTLKYTTLIATLQLVERICSVAVSLSDEAIQGLTWSMFVSLTPRTEMPELIQYLKERQLYVNEPVQTTEEV